GCSKRPLAPAPLPNMTNLPTRPLEFARPFGNFGDLDNRSSLADSPALAERITAFARCRISRFWASKYTTPVARPLLSTEISRTYELTRISQFPLFSAIGITVTAVLERART